MLSTHGSREVFPSGFGLCSYITVLLDHFFAEMIVVA
jgi:hypothetical protein